MRIYTMTATFGKLTHETLTLKPGLNIIEAPNEWGKSTWCAFLIAMLYGIPTAAHTTKTALADKDRYAPWSGAPMSGRMELCWNGRDITIERSTKGKRVFGIFRAFETDTGLEIPELTADNCGEMLLGVERRVFARAGFVRLTDLPVTEDDALRRRLNALVTTGDESGTADTLSTKLKELKNRCRANRSNGLIPQALSQKEALEETLQELHALRSQSADIRRQQEQQLHKQRLLANHLSALDYAAHQQYRSQKAAAEAAQTAALQKVSDLTAACAALPSQEELTQQLERLQKLREQKEAIQLQSQLLPGAPTAPQAPVIFQGLDPADALRQTTVDFQVYETAKIEAKRLLPGILGLIIALGSLLCLLLPAPLRYILTGLGVVAGIVVLSSNIALRRRAERTVHDLQQKYVPLEPHKWVDAATAYGQAISDFAAQQRTTEENRQALLDRYQQINQQLSDLTDGLTPQQCEKNWLDALQQHKALADANWELSQTQLLTKAISGSAKEVSPPQMADSLTLSRQETEAAIAQCSHALTQLNHNLGICQGRMETLGQESALQQQLEAVNTRLQQLEDTYAALSLAQDTLAAATAELQRRFAPRISLRAQELLQTLTGGRYTRLSLAEDFTLHAGAQGEDTLHSALWRSEGTIDQLYLALRLAVAESLTPEAPLILDDALVRFDDTRLEAALSLLQQTAQEKQVLLFTCQSREKKYIEEAL